MGVLNCHQEDLNGSHGFKTYNAELVLNKPWRPKFFLFEILMNVLVRSFRSI